MKPVIKTIHFSKFMYWTGYFIFGCIGEKGQKFFRLTRQTSLLTFVSDRGFRRHCVLRV